MAKEKGKLVSIKIDDATDKQLRDFARQRLGLPITNQSRSQVLAQIATVWDKPKISIHEETEKDEAPAAPEPVADEHGIPRLADGSVAEPTWDILIPETDDADGKQPVFAGVNGRGIYIERSTESTIKHRYYVALTHAIKSVGLQIDEKTIEMRSMPQYPFNVLMPPDRKHLLAWQEQDRRPKKKRKVAAQRNEDAEAA